MQRNYLRGLLICVIPCLLAGLFAVRLDKYRLGIDLAGGTILVYEINLERTLERRKTLGEGGGPTTEQKEGLTTDEMNQLAAQIKRRIDPTDIKNVTVRPLGRTRVEIILPLSGAAGSGKANLSEEEIEETKRLISQMGVLEFRIVANGFDDKDGIQAARDAIKARSPAELLARANSGLAPAGPEGEFPVEINDTRAKVRYLWVELGPEEREQYGLSNSFSATKMGAWGALEAVRDQAVPLVSGPSGGIRITSEVNGCRELIYSRKCTSRDQLAKEENDFKKLKAESENRGKSDEEIWKLVNRKQYEYFILTRVSPDDTLRVGGDVTLTANPGTDKSYNLAVEFRFNGAGAQLFGKITRRNKPPPNKAFTRQLAIVLDEQIMSAPSINSEITSQGIIEGGKKGFDRKTVDRLVQILRSGALSAELKEKPVSENMIGPTLGADTIRRGTTAVGLAFVAILAFMLVYYRFAGVVACIALFANLLLTVGFMVAVNAAFTLPGLAGLVLTLGMAVDANVLIYERLREERNKGANLITAIRNGYDRAFPTIIDTHLTSIFTAIVLYTFGNDNLKGFAISLTLGLVISLFTSLYVTRLIFDYWQHRKWLTELKMMRLFEKPTFHPMKYRYLFFSITGGLTILGLALFLARGEAGLNVDFRGGTVFTGELKPGEERSLTTADGKTGLRELLSEENQKKHLNVKSVLWENKPTAGSTKRVNTYVYTITYADDSTATVTLTTPPAGNPDEEAMKADVKARASKLPDVSVEQTFTAETTFSDRKSSLFTVRTTEKEPELVRASLDRLLRNYKDDKGYNDSESLMLGPVMQYGPEVKDAAGNKQMIPKVDKGKVELTFTRPTSLAYVTGLFDRTFRTELRQDLSGVEGFTLVGTPNEGRYTKLTLDVSKNPAFDQLAAATPDPVKMKAQLASLAQLLKATKSAFDAAPEPARLEVFDSQLAKETRSSAFVAIVASWVAILLYLWFRFLNWTFGLAAVICLIHDLCFTLGAIAACHYLHLIPGFDYLGIQDFKIDLPAVAALLTLVGYSVSDTIVVFDRIREVRGKNPKLTPQMINDSVNQTLSRTILTATTVFLVSFVLYAAGGEGVHLFAFVMVMGVLVGTYSSVFVAAPLLLMFGEGHDDPDAHTTTATATAEEGETQEESSTEQVVEG